MPWLQTASTQRRPVGSPGFVYWPCLALAISDSPVPAIYQLIFSMEGAPSRPAEANDSHGHSQHGIGPEPAGQLSAAAIIIQKRGLPRPLAEWHVLCGGAGGALCSKEQNPHRPGCAAFHTPSWVGLCPVPLMVTEAD